ncbi:MAG: ATP-binding protein [Anaerolineales bacterium]|jgi:signal transduction histidine kinase
MQIKIHLSGVCMGLGLIIAQDILHAYGGEIELQSMPDEGTQFTIWLPKS